MQPTIPTIPSWFVGMLRALGIVIVLAVAHFFGNAANLTPFVSGSTAAMIALAVGALEHLYEAKTGSALFGAIRTR